MARKTNRANFGSVRKLSSGRYQARYPDENGIPMNGPQTYVSAEEAWEHIATVRADRSRGIYHDPRRGERLLGDFAREWIANGGSRGKLAIRTRELYEDLLTRHIAPTIGQHSIGKVTPAAVRNWHTALGKELAKRAAEPRKDTTNAAPRIATGATRQRQAYALLKSIMNTAHADGLIGKNPCQIVGAGQVKLKERPLIGLVEFAQLVEAHPADLRPVLHAAFGAHLRLGEVVALTRGDYDAKAATLRVREQVVFSRTEGEVRTKTKTDTTDTIDLPAATVTALDAYLKTVPKALPSAPLFVRADGRKLTRAQVQHAWDKAREAVGLEHFHLHDIRHAGLTLSAQSGATVRELMERARHSTSAAALVYQHAAEERGKIIAANMNAAMTGTAQQV